MNTEDLAVYNRLNRNLLFTSIFIFIYHYYANGDGIVKFIGYTFDFSEGPISLFNWFIILWCYFAIRFFLYWQTLRLEFIKKILNCLADYQEEYVCSRIKHNFKSESRGHSEAFRSVDSLGYPRKVHEDFFVKVQFGRYVHYVITGVKKRDKKILSLSAKRWAIIQTYLLLKSIFFRPYWWEYFFPISLFLSPIVIILLDKFS